MGPLSLLTDQEKVRHVGLAVKMVAAFGWSEDAGGAGTCPTYDGADSKAPAPHRQILHSVQNDMGAIFRGMTLGGQSIYLVNDHESEVGAMLYSTQGRTLTPK